MSRPTSLLDRLANRRMRRLWKQTAEQVPQIQIDDLLEVRAEMRDMRRSLDRLIYSVEGRLASPRLGADTVHRPPGSDVAWRPDLWRGPVEPAGIVKVEARTRFAPDVALHHNCPLGEVTFHQLRNRRQDDLSPYGVALDVLGFEGSYLSLAIDLPPAAIDNLSRRHIIHFEMSVEQEGSLSIRPRLNIKSGPNTEYVDSWVERTNGRVFGDFDLGFTKINEKRVERAWVTLFLDNPQMSRVVIRDLTMSRRFRAEV